MLGMGMGSSRVLLTLTSARAAVWDWWGLFVSWEGEKGGGEVTQARREVRSERREAVCSFGGGGGGVDMIDVGRWIGWKFDN